MSEPQAAKYKTPFLILAALFVIWGILGLIDLRNVPYSGFNTDGNNTVTRVDAGSPAESAGLRVGHYIPSIGGIPVENARALAARPRPEIGETWTLVVEQRDPTVLAAGEEAPATENVDITFAASPGRQTFLGYAAVLIGLCFIVFGLMPYLRVPTRSSTLLALVGLCLGVAFFAGPYLTSYWLRTIAYALTEFLVILGCVFLLHYVMGFPQPKAMLAKKHTLKVIYVPALFVALFVLFTYIFQPTATSAFNIVARSLFGLFVVVYFGLALAAMIHSYVKASPQERSNYGLNLMLIGVLIGLLPITIAVLIVVLAPTVVLPGSDFYFLTFILIPITLAMAAMRKESAPAEARATAPLM
jgi:hypothetical protein